MTDIPCPKCGSATSDIGGKQVCSECYWVIDGSPSSAGAKARPQPAAAAATAEPAPQVQLSKDPNAPLVLTPSTPQAPLAPRPCPKCGGEATDAGGRLVCSKCYWVIDQPALQGKTTDVPPTAMISIKGLGILVAVLTLLIAVAIMIALPQLQKLQPPPGTTPSTTTSTPSTIPPSTGVPPSTTVPPTTIPPATNPTMPATGTNQP